MQVTADDAAKASDRGCADAGRVAALTAALGGLREKVKRRDAATAEVITGTVERLRLAEADGARLQLELRSTQLALEAATQATSVENTSTTQVKTYLRDDTLTSSRPCTCRPLYAVPPGQTVCRPFGL